MGQVSVVIPVYNAGPYLDDCLESVLAQTYSDLQVICVDDGSTDPSRARIDAVARTDPRVKCLTVPTGGPGAARNIGVGLATGDFLSFVDADDVVPPLAIERLVGLLEATGSDFACGQVMRMTSTAIWPSELHRKAIRDARLKTHIARLPSLLYDTTSWNKLFRRSFWDIHRFRYPEGVLYEDVCLMTEVHWQAASVDVIQDVVYHWRRRDDGVLSVTQRYLDPDNFADRLASLDFVRSLFADSAPASLRDAAMAKALGHDLAPFFRELPQEDRAFTDFFVARVADFLHGVSDKHLRRLPPLLALEYHLVRHHAVDQLLGVIDQGSRTQTSVPAVRSRMTMRLDVPDGNAVVPRSLTNMRRRLPVVCGVDRLAWRGDHLLVQGYAAISGMAFNRPTSAMRRLQFTDAVSHRSFSVWITPRRHDGVDASHSRDDTTYRWAGFSARIPVVLLQPREPHGVCRWAASVQILGPFAGKGRLLGPAVSGIGWFLPPLLRDGVLSTARWSDDRRLQIVTQKVSVAVHRVSLLGENGAAGATDVLVLRVELRATAGTNVLPGVVTLRATEFALPQRFVIAWDDAPGADRRGCADIPLSVLTGLRGERPYVAVAVDAGGRSTSGPIATAITEEVAIASGADTVLVRPNRLGDLELVLVPPRVLVSDSGVEGRRLVLRGMSTLSDEAPRLVLRNGVGEEVAGDVSLDGSRFTASFDIVDIPGPYGPHVLPAGRWALTRLKTGHRDEAVFCTRGRTEMVDHALVVGTLDAEVRVDQWGHIALRVYALPVALRGSYAQARARERHYLPAFTQPSRDLVLFETWQGKSAADNPGELLNAALASGMKSELVVSVRDASVITPPGVARVIRWSPEYYRTLAAARLIVANDSLSRHVIKRPDQRILQTWHGTPIKRIGFDLTRVRFRNRNYLEELADEVARWDWLLSQNSYSTELLRKAFRFDGPVWETGYPRTDALFGERAARARERTRAWLGAGPDTLVVLWAPTWRDDTYGRLGGYALPVMFDLPQLEDRLPADTMFLIRAHHLVTDQMGTIGGPGGRVRNVSAYPDVNDLYLASDALVTDYSSVMFDYAVTGKPILLHVPDLTHYRDDLRGHYLDLAEIAPGPMVADGDVLVDHLHDLDAVRRDNATRYALFRERFCSLDDGKAATRVWTLLSAGAPGWG